MNHSIKSLHVLYMKALAIPAIPVGSNIAILPVKLLIHYTPKVKIN